MDTITKSQRSALMSRIKSKDTKPEMAVRSMLHRLGFRFRLHVKNLPGRPDIVLPRHGKIVLVHGCFWHGHGCQLASTPKSNTGYWSEKIAGNCARDIRTRNALLTNDWQVLEIWECEVRAMNGLIDKLQRFMERGSVGGRRSVVAHYGDVPRPS